MKVWSRGAFRKETAGGDVTELHVGLDIHATGDQRIEVNVSKVALESVWLKEQTLQSISGATHSGPTVTPAKTTSSTELTFKLPPGVSVSDVGAFRVQWFVKATGREFTEFTPFVQQERRPAYVPIFAYYHPYCVPGWPCFASPFYYGRPVMIVRHYPRRVVVRGMRRGRPARR